MKKLIQKITAMLDITFLKFLIVGIINTVVGSAIMFSLYNFAGCSYWVSTATNYVLTSILSFFLNKYFTFQNKEFSYRQMLKFVINIVVCYILAYGISAPLVSFVMGNVNNDLKNNISMLIGMVLFTMFNYLGQRLFTFRGK